MLDTDTCIAMIMKHQGALRRLRRKSIGQVEDLRLDDWVKIA